MSETRSFRIGLDWGQRQDHSAVCLVEDVGPKAVVRLLTKYPLGTSYPLVTKTVADVYRSAVALGQVVDFTADATGVGSVPTQMLQQVIPDASISAFVFTNQKKRELIGKIKILHSFGRLRFATRRGDEVYNRTLTELINELRQLQAKVIRDDPQNPEIEVFKTGKHDDLVSALVLACKDIEIRETWDDGLILHEDTTWVKNVLTEPTYGEPVFFG